MSLHETVFIRMTRGFKLVAAALAFVLLASGVSAFGTCVRGDAATSPQCCGPHCGMKMKVRPTGFEFQAKAKGAACCKMSPVVPAPASTPQVPSHRWLSTPLFATVEPLESLLPALDKALRAGVPPGKSSPPLATLGILLI